MRDDLQAPTIPRGPVQAGTDRRLMDTARQPTPGLEQVTWLTRLALLGGIGYLLFATFRPFFSALTWAAVLSYGLYPLYKRLVRATGDRHGLSAAVMSIGVTVGVVLPLVYVSLLIGKEVARTYMTVVRSLDQSQGLLEQWRGQPLVTGLLDQLQEFQRVTGTDIRTVLVENLADLGKALVQGLTDVAGNLLAGLAELAIILLCTFFFFRDGEGVVLWLKDLLPMTTERQHLVIARFGEVVKGLVFGNTLVAVLEGAIGGLAFWIVGLPAVLLWASVMAILAYLPVVGAALVWGPAALYLIAQGAYLKAVVLGVAGGLIAIVDYVVRTIVVGGASKLHALLTLFGVLGGIQFFGLVGIVAGPLVVAIGVALFESFRIEKAGLVIPSEPPGVGG